MRSKKAFLNLFTNLLREGVSIFCGFILPYVIISSFGSEIYGLTESITNFLGFIVLLEAGFGPVVKVALYKALAKKDLRQIKRILKTSEVFFRRIAVIFLFYILGLAVIYPVISESSLNYLFTASLVIIMSISTFAEYFFGITYRLLLQSDQRTYITNIIHIITMLLNLCFVIIAVNCGSSIIVVKIITGVVFLLRPILQNVYIKKHYNISLNRCNADYKIEQKWDALAHHVAFMVHTRTDIIILTVLSSLDNVAIYSVYALVLNGVKSIVSIMAESFSATFGDMIARSEKITLRKRFNSYETIFLTISTVVYSCTLLLITPFVSVYTRNIGDVNYIQPLFGVLLTLGVYLLTIRQPYNELVKAAGHFKQTRRGAFVEAVVNIVLSIILVWNYGLIGVAIGTLVAMLIRTIEFIYHSNRYILEREARNNIKKVIVMIVETIVVIFVVTTLPSPRIISYLDWFLYAFETFIVAVLIVLPANYLLFKADFKDSWKTFKNVTGRSDRNRKKGSTEY